MKLITLDTKGTGHSIEAAVIEVALPSGDRLVISDLPNDDELRVIHIPRQTDRERECIYSELHSTTTRSGLRGKT